jgi:hypothetical protein
MFQPAEAMFMENIDVEEYISVLPERGLFRSKHI